MNTATKVGNSKYSKQNNRHNKKNKVFESEFAKTASKRIVQKSAEATGDLIRNKIADKITSLQKINKMKQVKKKKLLFHQKRDNKSLMT